MACRFLLLCHGQIDQCCRDLIQLVGSYELTPKTVLGPDVTSSPHMVSTCDFVAKEAPLMVRSGNAMFLFQADM